MKTTLSLLFAITISILGFSQTPTTNLQVQGVPSDTRAFIEWQETNDTSLHLVDYFKVRYNIIGDTGILYKQKTYDYNQFPIVRTRLQSLNPNTQYEFQIKTVFNDGSATSYSPSSYLTTGDTCANVGNLAVSSPSSTKATFTWSVSNGAYSFVRIKIRENNPGAPWFHAGGMGVTYPATTKNKNGLAPGVEYRAQARTWCGTTYGLPYKSASWTSLIYWTQPNSARLSQSNNIELLKVTDLLGRESKIVPNKILIFEYSDGSFEKKMIQE